MKRTTETITFSLPPAMAAQVRAVMRAEGRTMSDLVREALRLYMEEREWRQVYPFRAAPSPVEPLRQLQPEATPMRTQPDPTPAALYARVSSDRQGVGLSVASQLRALRNHNQSRRVRADRAEVAAGAGRGSRPGGRLWGVGGRLAQSVRRAQAHEPGGAHARPRRCRAVRAAGHQRFGGVAAANVGGSTRRDTCSPVHGQPPATLPASSTVNLFSGPTSCSGQISLDPPERAE